MLILLGVAAAAAGQEKRMAVVEFSTSYLRLEPEYESPLETQGLMGTGMEVITPQPYRAWCTNQGLVEMTQEQLKAYNDAPKVMYNGLYGHIYTERSLKSATLCDLVGGDILRFGPETEKRARKALRGRWTQVMLPSGKTGYVPSKELKLHQGWTSIAMGEGSAESISPDVTEKIIAQAEKLLGVPYLWGGMSAKGVDCSGLVRFGNSAWIQIQPIFSGHAFAGA